MSNWLGLPPFFLSFLGMWGVLYGAYRAWKKATEECDEATSIIRGLVAHDGHTNLLAGEHAREFLDRLDSQ